MEKKNVLLFIAPIAIMGLLVFWATRSDSNRAVTDRPVISSGDSAQRVQPKPATPATVPPAPSRPALTETVPEVVPPECMVLEEALGQGGVTTSGGKHRSSRVGRCKAKPSPHKLDVEVKAPGWLAGMVVKCRRGQKFELRMRVLPEAGRALLVRSTQCFALDETILSRTLRDMRMGDAYAGYVDLDYAPLCSDDQSRHCAVLIPSTEEQTFYFSTLRTPE